MNVIMKGAVVKIFDTEEIGKNGFKKRALVLKTYNKYPQELLIEFVKDNIENLDSIGEGEIVNIAVNILGRKWTSPEGVDKWFNTLQGWNIESAKEESPEPLNFGTAENPNPDAPF